MIRFANFDIAGLFNSAADLPYLVYYHTAVLLANGNVLIAGGMRTAQTISYLNLCALYNASTGILVSIRCDCFPQVSGPRRAV